MKDGFQAVNFHFKFACFGIGIKYSKFIEVIFKWTFKLELWAVEDSHSLV